MSSNIFALMNDQTYLDNLESNIVHRPVHVKNAFVQSWEFVMLVVVIALSFGFLLGLGLSLVL